MLCRLKKTRSQRTSWRHECTGPQTPWGRGGGRKGGRGNGRVCGRYSSEEGSAGAGNQAGDEAKSTLEKKKVKKTKRKAGITSDGEIGEATKMWMRVFYPFKTRN